MYKIQKMEFRGEHVFKASFTGVFEHALVLNFIDKMAEQEKTYPGNKLLVDFTAVTKIYLDHVEVNSIVQYVKANDMRRGKTAFVTGDNLDKIMFSDLYVLLVKGFRPNQEKSFTNIEQAIEWLCPNNGKP